MKPTRPTLPELSNKWPDREGSPLKKGDWITDPKGRNFEILGQTPGGFLSLETDDGKPFSQWLLGPEKIRECLRNPILSPN